MNLIEYIKGKVLYDLAENKIVVFVGDEKTGVGYGVLCPYGYHYNSGDIADLQIVHIITEKSQALYGFKIGREKHLFKMLISVDRVGPGLALRIVSNVDVTAKEFNIEAIKKVKGVGDKMYKNIKEYFIKHHT